MTQITFATILDAADQLPLEDQENLIDILQKRLRDHRRAELVQEVQQAQQEFAQGQCKIATPQQIIEEILSSNSF
jgi:transcriptional regulator of heat shock response